MNFLGGLDAELELCIWHIVPNPNKINGKKLISEILPRLNFSFKHPNYKTGYAQMIAKLKKTID